MTNSSANDLKVAASFVRWIDTGDHEMNDELQRLADRLDGMLDERSPGRTGRSAALRGEPRR